MSIHWYAHHLGDYSKNTRQLTLLEHGAYRQLLDYYYTNEGPFSDDLQMVYRACSAHTPSERRAVLKVLQKYFVPHSGVWNHDRADKEIKKQHERSQLARDKANKRHAGAVLGHVPEPCYPTTNNQQPTIKEEREANVNQNEFEEFWAIYPRNVAKQSALKAFTQIRRKGVSHEDVIAGARQYAAECRGREQRWIAHPATWLNAGRWDDAPGANLDATGRGASGTMDDRSTPKSKIEIAAELIGELSQTQRQ